MRLRRLTAAALACAALGLPVATPAAAAPSGAAGGAHFAVGAAADLLAPDRKGVVRTFLSLTNTGATPLRITLRPVGVKPLDDGRVQITDKPDPVWASASQLPPAVTLPAQGYRQVPLTITVPAGLQPDIYLLGYVADGAPTRPTEATTVVRSQISTLVTVQLPGPRPRRVEIEPRRSSFLHIGKELTGSFRVRNTGVAAAVVHGQVRLDSAVGESNLGVVAPENRRSLLPAGTSRTMTYRWATGRLWTYIRPTVEVAYSNDTAAPLTVMRVGRPMLLLPVHTIVLIAAILAVLIALVVRLVVRRRSGKTGGRRRATGTSRAASGRHRVRAGAAS